MHLKKLSEQVIVITGASSGIGRATAAKLSEAGVSVLAVGRNETSLGLLTSGARDPDAVPIEPFVADLGDPGAAARIVEAADRRFGGIDILVNAAGLIAMGTIETTTDESWERMMAVNATAPFQLMHAAVPHLIERKGCVVNVSSVNGLRSFAGVLAYCVSKSALDQLTRCAALELAPKGVRVNAVNPGVTVTNLHRRAGMGEDQYRAFLERSKETHPIGRPGQADEIADLILFLCSPRAAWITGDTISIDGGRHLTCAR
jgi:NAD(P)-dependent dehydrogenase (short-subunit alcohol dehydrogenase family)